MPKVSVIVPIYNAQLYLKECLDSLVNQTLSDIEFICINDGSTDSSLEILKEYQKNDSRIKIIDKPNSGYGATMNIGLGCAQGEYIGIVEPDDFVKKQMFEDLYKIAIKNDSDLVKSDFFSYFSDTKVARKAGLFDMKKADKTIHIKDYVSLLKKQPSIWSAIYKKEFLDKNNIKFLETPGASFQDTSFSFKTFCLAKKMYLTNKAYLYYRQDNANSSVHAKDKVFAICDEYDEITKFLNENKEIKDLVNYQKLIKQYKVYIWNLKRIDKSFRDEFIDVFSKTFKAYYENNEFCPAFYLKVNRNEVKTLINNKEKYKLMIRKRIVKERIRQNRKKLLSVHINSSRVDIVLFGKQIVKIG